MDWQDWLKIIAVLAICMFFRIILGIIDSKTDYSDAFIFGEIKSTDKIRYIVPYYTWQRNKLSTIIERYKDYVEYNGKKYKVVIGHKDQPHPSLLTNNSSFFERDFVAELAPIDDSHPVVNSIALDISGNGNTLNINQNSCNSVEYEIEKWISPTSALSDQERDALLLFKYKMADNTASKTDANKVVDILTQYLPLTTAIIELINSLFM